MKHLIIGTAGHVDHGKTALVKALTGIDCDTHKEEKERGITINLGFSYLDLPGGESIGIVDVPGHKDFVKTMVAGAHGIDIAMPVIAADSGIMPQTKEHLRIIEMLGIDRGIIVITKSDLVDEETLELARLEAMDFVEGSLLEGAEVMAVSSQTGKGLKELREAIERMVASISKNEDSHWPFRLYIDRVFNVKGIGYVVTGTVINGKTQTGDELFLLPGKGKKVRVKGLERYGKTVEAIYKGDRAAINLADFNLEDFSRGMVLSGKILQETSHVDAYIQTFDHKTDLGIWSNAVFYSGTFECMARIHLLDKDLLMPGKNAIAQIHLSEPAILMNNDKFIIRNTSSDLTLGGGTVIDIKPLHHKKRTEKLVNDLKVLVNAVLHSKGLYDLVLVQLIKQNIPVLITNLTEIIEKPVEEIKNEIRKSERDEIILFDVHGNTVLLEKNLKGKYENIILEELKYWHEKFPLFSWGMGENEMAGKLDTGKIPGQNSIIKRLFEELEEKSLVEKSQDTWKLKDHKVTIDKKTQENLNWLEDVLRSYKMEKPAIAEIEQKARERKLSGDKLKMLLVYLSKEGKIYYNKEDLIHYDIVDQCRKLLLKDLSNKEKGINEKEFRELINGTKKVVQLLLEILLAEGVIRKETFFIHITEVGRKKVNGLK